MPFVRRAVVLTSLAAAMAPAAARAADHPLLWPGCCSTGSPVQTDAAVGDTVTFTTADFAQHPLVWNFGDFTTQSAGTSRQYAFPAAGTFPFHCQIHSYMVGRVKVGNDLHASPEFTFAPAAPKAGEAVTFTYAGTADPDGTIAQYQWDLDGNGSFETSTAQPSISHTYANGATMTVGLRVLDDGHETSTTATHAVTVTGGTGGAGGGTTPGGMGGTGTGGGTSTGAGGGATGGGSSGAGMGAGMDSSAGAGLSGAPGLSTSATASAPRATAVRMRRGRLLLTLSERATLRGILTRGTHRVRSVTARLPKGASAVRLGHLRPGRYRLRFTLTDVDGNRTAARTVSFTVR
jgi:plastocyanin